MPKKKKEFINLNSGVVGPVKGIAEVHRKKTLLKAGALQSAIFNSANFSSIATDAKGVIQIFNVGAERMLGYAAAEVMNKITPADISDPQEVIARAKELSVELSTSITPGFEALVFKASRGIEDIYELTYIRKDGSRFPAVVSVTALRDEQGAIIGYLLIGTDNTARKQAEEALLKAGALQNAIFKSANFSSIATDAKGVIQIFNVGAERMLGYAAAEVMNKITPADISDPQEVIARAKELSMELSTSITPGFEALVFKASRGIEDIYELTYIRKDGSRFPAVVSVTALRDEQDAIIGYLLIGTDNTARKQAEEALLKAGALQNAIFKSANFSSIATDAKGVIQIFNVGAERMLGYAAAEVMNKITPADISDPQEVIARAKELSVELSTSITPGFEALVFKASRGIEDIYELTYIRKDGSRFPAVVSVTALRDEQDAIIGYLLIGTDNTARKQAEEALRKAGALQSAIFNSANFSSIATDAKGVIQIFNVGAERMLGYAAAEVMNQITPADISDPQELIARAKELSMELETPITPGFEALVFKASRGIEDIYELTYIRKDGSRFPAIVSVTALRDAQNAIIGYLLIGTDNTARKQVEAEQRKLDQRLRDYQFYTRSLFESNIDALMTTDPFGIITDVNKQMEALTGCTRDELIGAPFKNYCTDPEVAEASIKMVLLEKKVSDYELTVRAWDGKKTVVSYNATTFYDRNRNLQGVFAAARDVTERKRADEALLEKTRQLEDLTHDLERRVKAEVELRFRNEQILIQQSKLAAMGEMLGAISHQWRQPLNALGLIIQDIKDAYNCGEMNQEYIEGSVQKSMAQIQHMSKTINDFRNFFRPDKEKTQFDTMRAIGDVLILLSAQLSANDIGYRLNCHIQGTTYENEAEIVLCEERIIVGYHNEFEHVVLNLINNAREAIVSRQSRVPPQPSIPGRIDFDFRQQDNAIVIEVGDNGGGIDPSIMDRIFEPYFTTKDPAKGTGLGLYMSKVIMEQMAGTLSIRNSEHGAVFVLTLPRPASAG